MHRTATILAMLCLGTAAALTGGCKSPPTQSEMAAYDYGPRPHAKHSRRASAPEAGGPVAGAGPTAQPMRQPVMA